MQKCYVPLNSYFTDYKIAHRGLHSETVSENSLQSFQRAIEGGFAIEIDIHLLQDGELAVVHDDNLKRVTGFDVEVESLRSDELASYPLLLNGEKIPTLKETLALIDGKAPLLIELKFNHGFDHRQADALLAQLESYPHKEKIALQSFHPAAVKYLKKKTAEYSVGFLTSYKLHKGRFATYMQKSLRVLKPIKADFISYDICYLPNKYVAKKRKQGYQLLCWTINSQEKLARALSIADNVIFEKIEV